MPVAVNEIDFGIFYQGDCYIVLQANEDERTL